MSCDALVIGGGPNGLVAATILGRAGLSVTLCEAGPELGGGMAGYLAAPGLRSPGTAHLLTRFDPEAARAAGLDLAPFETVPAPTVLLAPDGPVVLRGAWGERIEGVAADEAAAFGRLRAQLLAQAGVFARLMRRPPPVPGETRLRDLAPLAGAGLALLRLGRAGGRDLMRMALTNVADVADEYLADDRLKGLLAFDAVLGAHLGPRSPGSLLGLHYRLAGTMGGQAGAIALPPGGMQRLAAALGQRAAQAGVVLRAATPVARVLAEQGRVHGLVTEAGETLLAPVVVSAIHPQATFLSLLDPAEVETAHSRAARRLRSAGNVAKLTLGLSALPEIPGVAAGDLGGRLVIAPSAEAVEQAFNSAKYGEFSPAPTMEITLQPAGGSDSDGHTVVLSALVQFAPYRLRAGWEAGKPALLRTILATLEAHMPGLSAITRASALETPADLEARLRLPGGHWHHGEMQPDQLLMNRPFHGAAGYATALDGLYLASAGSHPGGGVSGLPGLLAARRILKEAGR